jgi:hypothetical protein
MQGGERTIHRPTNVRREQAASRRDPQRGSHPCRTRQNALPKGLLYIALVIGLIGCDGKVRNKISVPENPTPRPDPTSRLEFGEIAKTPGPAGSLERSTENRSSAPRKSGP